MKHCPSCNTDKFESEFAKNSSRKDGLQGECRKCKQYRDKGYYGADKRRKYKVKERRKNSVKRNRNFILDYLNSHPCVECGEKDIRVLEFDHVRGVKINALANLVRMGCSESKIKSEIDKCEVRCSNCHKKRTYKGTWRDIRD